MKKVITVFLFYLFVNSSQTGNSPDEYVIFLTEENGTVHKCKRIDYLEILELMQNCNPNENETKNYNRIIYEESLTYTELLREKRIEY